MIPVKVGGKIVGHIAKYKNRVVYVTYRNPEHFFRKYEGFGISEAILRKLKDMNIKFILILYKDETGVVRHLLSRVDDWFEHGHRYRFLVERKVHVIVGKTKPIFYEDFQRVLPIAYMEEVDRETP